MASKRTLLAFRSLTENLSGPSYIGRSSNSSLCARCSRLLAQQHRSSNPLPQRPFSTSVIHYKKKGNKNTSRNDLAEDSAEHIPDNKATANRDAEIDPYDHSDLEAGIANAIARLKEALSKTRDAGRVTVEMIEALPVELNIKHPEQSNHHSRGKSESPHHEQAKLGNIASVVPKGGRTMQVFAAEQGHVKPLTAGILASPYSLNPDIDKNNPLLILVPVPPATAETRAQAAVEVKKCFDRASLDVRNARGDAQKRHRKMEKERSVIRDELMKAHKGMEEVAKKGQEEVQKLYDGALKALQQ